MWRNRVCYSNLQLMCVVAELSGISLVSCVLQVLFRGHSSAIVALAAHPSLPRLITAGYSTLLQLWDYQTK